MSGHFDAMIVGGGAAGLMCALTAGRRGKRVLVVEHANRVGKKILMSGGGRCNFTNTGATPAELPVGQPAFLQVGAGALHAVAFHRHGRAPRHRVPREGTGPAVLRCVVQAHREDAARRMRRCRRARGDQLQRRARQPRRERRRALPPAHHARQLLGTGAGGRQRRTVDPEHGRHRLRLRTGPPVRPCRAAHARRPGAADPQRQAPGATGRTSAASPCRSTAQLQRRRASAISCWSRTAASAARRSCRSPRTGSPATTCAWTCCPATTHWKRCNSGSANAPPPNSRPCSATWCPSVSHSGCASTGCPTGR